MKVGITRNGQLVQTVEVNALSMGELGLTDPNILPAERYVEFGAGRFLGLFISWNTLISLIKENSDNKIQAIKLLRMYADMGLKEAKIYCDAVWAGEIK